MRKNLYLERYAWPSIGLHEQIAGNPGIIVVIPAFCESEIDLALRSLHQCTPPGQEVAILVIVNEPKDATAEVVALNEASLYKASQVKTTFAQYTAHVRLPPKKAGVGLARKIGMDEAVRFFESRGGDGTIVCYDADCTCEPNYLRAIADFYQHPGHNLGLVHYEHQLGGPNHEAIVNYELFLRYYIQALRIAGYPFAIHTLGSCITVRSSAYQKQGGMNTRKAGEDFYFIHKITPLGGIGEINTTTIHPSDRVSYRVPFGTGHAVDKYLSSPDETYQVYHPQIFEDLHKANQHLEILFREKCLPDVLPMSLMAFYEATNFESDLTEILSQSGSFLNFQQRYYRWWDGFKVLKFVHFSRDRFHEHVALSEGLHWLAGKLDLNLKGSQDEQLRQLRRYDREDPFQIRW